MFSETAMQDKKLGDQKFSLLVSFAGPVCRTSQGCRSTTAASFALCEETNS